MLIKLQTIRNPVQDLAQNQNQNQNLVPVRGAIADTAEVAAATNGAVIAHHPALTHAPDHVVATPANTKAQHAIVTQTAAVELELEVDHHRRTTDA